jgi:monoamine oxidase
LVDNGASVRVLEARERVGGRIYTVRPPHLPCAVELGAEFVHGKHPELWRLIREAGLSPIEVSGQPWCFENGNLHPCDDISVDGVLQHLSAEQHDRTFAEFLADRPEGAGKEWARAYVEGFNAAYAEVLGVRGLLQQGDASQQIGGDAAWRIPNGYDAVLSDSGLDVRLNTPVREVRWRRGRVEAEEFVAGRAIVTAPLPVLRKIHFDPMPAGALAAAQRLAMGSVVRVTFEFAERFWDPAMSFLFSTGATMPTWWTTCPLESNLLTGWSAAHAADRLQRGDVMAGALGALAALFRKDVRPLLKNCWWHDWSADRFSLGAYSYTPAGATGARMTLSEPVQQTLYFAGEHTDTSGHTGTVHGAIVTGLRAARQVLGFETT